MKQRVDGNENTKDNDKDNEPVLSAIEALDQFASVQHPTHEAHQPDSMDQDPLRGEISVLRFGVRIGDVGLLLEAGINSQVLDRAQVSQIPLTPRWFSGMTNVRGNLVPVFNLYSLFEIEDDQSNPRTDRLQLLMLDKDQYRVAFHIQSLPQLAKTDHVLQHPLPLPSALQGYVRQMYRDGDQTWLAFEHREFFTTLGAKLAG